MLQWLVSRCSIGLSSRRQKIYWHHHGWRRNCWHRCGLRTSLSCRCGLNTSCWCCWHRRSWCRCWPRTVRGWLPALLSQRGWPGGPAEWVCHPDVILVIIIWQTILHIMIIIIVIMIIILSTCCCCLSPVRSAIVGLGGSGGFGGLIIVWNSS